MTRAFLKAFWRPVTTLSVKRIRRRFVEIAKEENDVAQIALTNAPGRNCVNVQLLEELSYVLSTLSEKWNLRSVIIKSAVRDVFSSGMFHKALPLSQ